MGEKELLKALSVEGVNECNRIINTAIELGSTEITRLRSEAGAAREKALAEERYRLKKEADREVASALSRSGAEITKAKTKIIDNIFEESLKQVAKLDKKKYSSYLQFLYDELAMNWPSEVEARAYVSPKDIALVNPGGTALEPDDSVELGVVFKSVDGRYCFSSTASSRLDKAKAELITKLTNILFREDG